MKQLTKLAVLCCTALFCSFAMVSCGERNEGDHLYDVTTAEFNAASNSYVMYAQEDIMKAVEALGAIRADKQNTYFIYNGEQKACDKNIAKAVDKAMNQIEAKDDYCSVWDISGVTVVVNRQENNENIEVFSRTFKAKN